MFLHFVGGTVGLFTGLSLVSLVETLFWFAIWVKSVTIGKMAKSVETEKEVPGSWASKTKRVQDNEFM